MEGNEFDADDAQGVLDTIGENHQWNLNSTWKSESEATIVGVGSRAQPARAKYCSQDTDGQLEVAVPSSTTGVAEILLVNPLDPALSGNTGEFVKAVGDGHSRRAATYCGPYFAPLSNPDLIAQALIPEGFDRQQLQDELDAVHSASVDVDKMHDRIWEPLAS